MRMLATLALLGVATLASAGSYHVGYTYSDYSGSYTLAPDGYWYSAGAPYTLHERSERVWNARKYCYEYVTYYTYKPVVLAAPVPSKDRWAALAEAVERDRDNQLYAAALAAAFGHKDVYGTRELKLYDGYKYEKTELFSQIDLNALMQYKAHNNETSRKLNAEEERQYSSVLDKLAEVAGKSEIMKRFTQSLIEIERSNKPTAVYQEKTPVPEGRERPQLQIDPVVEQLSMDERGRILRDHLLSVDPNKHMPRGGATINAAEILLWMKGDHKPINEKYKCNECHAKNPTATFRIK